MNPREKSLAIAVGGLSLIVALFFGWSSYQSAVNVRNARIEGLKREVLKASGELRVAQKATVRLHEYQARALPADPDLARSLYQKWLLEKAQQAGLAGQNTASVSTRPLNKLGWQFTFNAKGEASLPQVVKLLDGIYRDDLLQRITKLSLKPLNNSKLLDVTITLEAVALNKADATTSLPAIPSTKLTLPDADAYAAVICGRNLFSPKNNPPALGTSSLQQATLNREFSVTLEGKDADPLDKVKFELLEADPGVTLDPQTGRLRWTPKETGRKQFTVQLSDDGIPSARSKHTLTVNVSPPPPPEPPKVVEAPKPMKLAFDQAKYTVLAAVVEVNDEREVWLHVRPTGETLKLKAGGKFEIGSIKGVVSEIGDDEFTFTAAEKLRRVTKGDTLEGASEVSGEPGA